jgi:hypothetical protein
MVFYYLLLILTPFWSYPRLPTFGVSFTVIKIVGVLALMGAIANSINEMRGGRCSTGRKRGSSSS